MDAYLRCSGSKKLRDIQGPSQEAPFWSCGPEKYNCRAADLHVFRTLVGGREGEIENLWLGGIFEARRSMYVRKAGDDDAK